MKKNILLTGAAGPAGLEALRQSDPYRALQQRDRQLLRRFFRDANLMPVR